MSLAEVLPVINNRPFPHFEIEEWFEPELADATLCWFETDAPWMLKETSFYEQYEFSLLGLNLPKPLCELVCPEAIKKTVTLFERSLGLSDRELAGVTAHRLTDGQRIRLHNDFIGGRETHRFIVQLNRGWTIANGGLLMLFSSASSDDVWDVLLPVHNSAFAFEISRSSYHAVSTVNAGERFTLVYTFRERNNPAAF